MNDSKEKFPSLDDHLCFMLYAASRAIQRKYYPTLNKNQLTYPQYLVLVILYEHSPLTVKELGHLLDLANGTLSPLLKRMEKEELIERHREDDDERKVLITITNKGREKRVASYSLPEILLDSTNFSESEWKTLNQLVYKLFNEVSMDGH